MESFEGNRNHGIVQGILSKKGHVVKNWRTRYFKLNFADFTLKYYSGEDGGALKGAYLITSQSTVTNIEDSKNVLEKFLFSLSAEKLNKTKKREKLFLRASDLREKEKWISALNEAARQSTASFITSIPITAATDEDPRMSGVYDYNEYSFPITSSESFPSKNNPNSNIANTDKTVATSNVNAEVVNNPMARGGDSRFSVSRRFSLSGFFTGNRDSMNVSSIDKTLELVLSKVGVKGLVQKGLLRVLNAVEKKTIVDLSSSVLEDMAGSVFSKSDEDLVTTFKSQRSTDSILLLVLKYRIANATSDWMHGFTALKGISVIVEHMDNCLDRVPLNDIDACALYELCLCMKYVMRTEGLAVVANTRGAIDAFIMSLNFEYKLLALEILELLSVCCFKGGEVAVWEIQQGFLHLAQVRNEEPYAVLVDLMASSDDLEMQGAVLGFINTLIMNEKSLSERMNIRNSLHALNFEVAYEAVIEENQINIKNTKSGIFDRRVAMSRRQAGSHNNNASTSNSMIKSGKTHAHVHGYNNGNINRKIPQTKRSSSQIYDPDFLAAVMAPCIDIDGVTAINPADGIMAGELFEYIEKNKKTLRFWCVLRDDMLQWWKHDKREGSPLGTLMLEQVQEVIRYGTVKALQVTGFLSFDLVLMSGSRKFYALEDSYNDSNNSSSSDNRLGKLTKAKWLMSLDLSQSRACRNRCAYSNNVTKTSERVKLTDPQMNKAITLFQKQVRVYMDVSAQDRKSTIKSALRCLFTHPKHCKAAAAAARLSTYLQLELHKKAASSSTTVKSSFDSEKKPENRLIALLQQLAIASVDITTADALWDKLINDARLMTSLISSDVLLEYESKETEYEINRAAAAAAMRRKRDNPTNGRRSVMRASLVGRASAAAMIDFDEEEFKNSSLVREQLELEDSRSNEVNFSQKWKSMKSASASPSSPMKKNALEDQADDNDDDNYAHHSPSSSHRSRTPFSSSTNGNNINSEDGDNDDNINVNIEEKDNNKVEGSITSNADFNNDEPNIKEGDTTIPGALTTIDEGDETSEAEGEAGEEDVSIINSNPNPSISETTVIVEEPVPDIALIIPIKFGDVRFDKFKKMKKMFPLEIVRHKMKSEGSFASDEIEDFIKHDDTVPIQPQQPPQQNYASSFETDERFVKYLKMKKMFPEDVVRHKMAMDGSFSPAEIEAFFGNYATLTLKSLDTNNNNNSVEEGQGQGNAEDVNVKAPPKYDVMKYKRLSSTLPVAALRGIMKKDKIPVEELEKIIAEIYGTSSAKQTSATAGDMSSAALSVVETKETTTTSVLIEQEPELLHGLAPKPVIKPTKKMRPIFLTKLRPKEVVDSVWQGVHEPDVDFSMLEQYFADERAIALSTAASSSSNRKSVNASATRKTQQIFDSQRTQNVSIIYGKLRKTPEALAEMVIRMDPDNLTKSVIEMMKTLIPSPEELEEINKREEHELDITSLIFKEMGKVPRLPARLDVQMTTLSWDEDANHVKRDLRIVSDAMKEVMQPNAVESLKLVLGVVLGVTNYINGGTIRGGAHGMKFEILAKLDNIKPSAVVANPVVVANPNPNHNSSPSPSPHTSVDGQAAPLINDDANPSSSPLTAPSSSSPMDIKFANRGTLLHFVVEVMMNKYPEQCVFFELWAAVWEAARINLKQNEDMMFSELKRKAEQARTELEFASTANVDPRFAEPLIERIGAFVEYTVSKIAEIEQLFVDVRGKLDEVKKFFGEPVDSNSSAMGMGMGSETSSNGCPSKAFFDMVVQFATKYGNAAKDIAYWKEQADKAAKRAKLEEERKAKIIIHGGRSKPGRRMTKLANIVDIVISQNRSNTLHDAQNKHSNSLTLEIENEKNMIAAPSAAGDEEIDLENSDNEEEVEEGDDLEDGDGDGSSSEGEEEDDVFEQMNAQQEKSHEEILHDFISRQRKVMSMRVDNDEDSSEEEDDKSEWD